MLFFCTSQLSCLQFQLKLSFFNSFLSLNFLHTKQPIHNIPTFSPPIFCLFVSFRIASLPSPDHTIKFSPLLQAARLLANFRMTQRHEASGVRDFFYLLSFFASDLLFDDRFCCFVSFLFLLSFDLGFTLLCSRKQKWKKIIAKITVKMWKVENLPQFYVILHNFKNIFPKDLSTMYYE